MEESEVRKGITVSVALWSEIGVFIDHFPSHPFHPLRKHGDGLCEFVRAERKGSRRGGKSWGFGRQKNNVLVKRALLSPQCSCPLVHQLGHGINRICVPFLDVLGQHNHNAILKKLGGWTFLWCVNQAIGIHCMGATHHIMIGEPL